jgi:hypothetical protein
VGRGHRAGAGRHVTPGRARDEGLAREGTVTLQNARGANVSKGAGAHRLDRRRLSLDPWWLTDCERGWFRTRLAQIASVLLSDALDGVAYHLVGFDAPQCPMSPDETGRNWWRTLSHFGQLVPAGRRIWPTDDDGSLMSVSALRAWLHCTVESWPLETGGRIGPLCHGLGIRLWPGSVASAQRDTAVLDGRTSDILDGLADLDTICAVTETTAERPLPAAAASLSAAVTRLRWVCWRPEWELRAVASRADGGQWLPGARTPRRLGGRPALPIWPLLAEVEQYLRRRHQNWRRDLDRKMPWTLVAHELGRLGCTNAEVDDVRVIARLAHALSEGHRRWRGGRAINGAIVDSG